MKKLTALILAVALLTAAIPPAVASAEGNGVFVVADGAAYKVNPGEVFEYVYYFNTGEQLCSLDGELFFDTEGLELIIPENEDNFKEEMIFTRLRYGVMVNQIEPGHIKFNYSNAMGTSYNRDTYTLIRAQFKVTASEGEYEINTFLHTVAGADEKRYIYNDAVINPLPCSGLS